MARTLLKTLNNKTRENLMINGAFDYWQRGTVLISPSYQYIADRWTSGNNYAGATSLQRTGWVPDLVNGDYSMRMTNTNATTLGTSEWIAFAQKIEGNRLKKVRGKDMILSFDVATNLPGKYVVMLKNGNDGGKTGDVRYAIPYTVTNNEAYERISLNISKINEAIGTGFNWDTNSGMGVWFIQAAGTNHHFSQEETWVVDQPAIGVAGMADFAGTAGAYFQIANVMLHEDDGTGIAQDFKRATDSIAEELQLCQRYYEKTYSLEVEPGTFTTGGMKYHAFSSGNCYMSRTPVNFLTPKRDNPTIVTYSTSSSTPNKVLLDGAVQADCLSRWTSSVGGSIGWTGVGANNMQYHWTAESEL